MPFRTECAAWDSTGNRAFPPGALQFDLCGGTWSSVAPEQATELLVNKLLFISNSNDVNQGGIIAKKAAYSS
jgi:hypothetical protein